MITLRIAVAVPDFIGRIAVLPLLFYRRIRFGYAFRRIPLAEGKYVLLDPDDYERIAHYTWNLITDGNNKYAVRFVEGSRTRSHKTISMHREIFSSPKGLCVDHINGNGLDNRKENLRLASKMQNCWNRKKMRGNCTSRFKGVWWNKKSKKWESSVFCDGKSHYLGFFNDEEAAARAYDAKARELYGEYARPNFPDDAKPLSKLQDPKICQNNNPLPPAGP